MAKMPAEKKRVTYPPVGQKRVCANVFVQETNRYAIEITVAESLNDAAAKEKLMAAYANGNLDYDEVDWGVCVPNHVERMLGNDVKFTIIPHPLTKKKAHAEALRHWETVIRSTLQDAHANDIADLIADKAHDLETDVREENY